MSSFTAALKNEFEKIYRRKKTTVIIILAIIITIIGHLIVFGVQNGSGIRVTDSINFSKLVLEFFINTILPLFTAMVVIDSFSGEFSKNTMKIALLRPVSRIKLFTSKIAAVGIFILVNLLIVMLISLLAGLLLKPAENMLYGIWLAFVSYMVSFLPLLALAIIVAFMANYFKSGTIVFFLSIVFYIIFQVLAVVFPHYETLFITSMIDWYKLWTGPTIPVSELIREFLMMLSYGIIFFTAGFYLFDKKEF